VKPWKAWERLDAEAEEKVARYDAFLPIVQQVDEQLAMIDLEPGTLRDAKTAAKCLRDLRKQLQG
jgi:soluble cytochrome b562